MRPAALAPLAVVLALAGCGGGTPAETQSAAIPRSVADELAAESESIAAAWEDGDECGAAQKADDLRHAVEDAIASGQIPAAYQDELAAAAVSLQNTANCPPEPEPRGEAPGKSKEKPEKPRKPEDHGKHGDDTTATTDATTTEEG